MLFILDGLAGHLSDAVDEECLFFGLGLVVILPHTSDQLQPFDFGSFAFDKLEYHRVQPKTDFSAQTIKILKIHSGLQIRSMPTRSMKALGWASFLSRWAWLANGMICCIDRDYAK
jgi:hypothetical protein